MNLLRSVIFSVFAIVLVAIFASLLVPLLLAPVSWRIGAIRIWRGMFMACVTHILGIRYTVKGRENIPAEPVVILCKHQSAWETVALQDVFYPRWLSFVYKKELHWVPFVGWGLASLPMISVDRGGGRDALRSVAEGGARRLREGHNVLVFPEGTRVAPGTTRRYKIGGAHTAVEAGAKVLPVAHDAGECWRRNAFVKQPGHVTISIGPAFDTTGMTAEQVNTRAEAWIEAEMRKISPHRYKDAAA